MCRHITKLTTYLCMSASTKGHKTKTNENDHSPSHQINYKIKGTVRTKYVIIYSQKV